MVVPEQRHALLQGSARIDHLALLIYSSQEQRVAIVDLRGAGLPLSLTAGETRTFTGWITSLPLVEGDYRIGLGLGTTDFTGDIAALVELRVGARARAGDHVPYHAAHRGLVELDFGLEP